MICVYTANTTNFNNNGLGVLSDSQSCLVDEELNGKYEITLTHPIDARGKWKNLVEDNILKVDGQLFRIYHKVINLTYIIVNARHIFYDLIDNFLEDVRPTSLNGAGALNWILTHTQFSHSFTSMSDINTIATKYFVRKNVVEAIMGEDGIIENWGGELVRDNFTIKLLQSRGQNNGILISYGKNIQGIEETLDMDSVCTRLMPEGANGILLTEKYIDSPLINNYPHPKIRLMDFQDAETEADLRTAAQNYMNTSKCDVPVFNYTIDFLELTQTEEYKNYAILESVHLGDIVTIKHTRLGINLTAKVISTEVDAITKKPTKIELGSFKPELNTDLSTTISQNTDNLNTKIDQNKTDLQKSIDDATTQINSALGGYVVKRNGELLIMDTENVATATKVWRWNENGLGYSSTGYNGQFRTAITANGHIVADFIDTGTLIAGLIKTGILSSKTGKWQLNFDGETINFGNKLIYDGNNLTLSVDVDLSNNTSVQNVAKNQVTALNVGVTQLLRNSGWNTDSSHWSNSLHWTWDNTVKFNNQNTFKFDASGITTVSDWLLSNNETECKPGDTFTGSIYVMSDDITTFDEYKLELELNFIDSNGNVLNHTGSPATPSVNNVWQRFSFIQIAPANAVKVRFAIYAAKNGHGWVAEPKLETGTKMTDWTLATIDLQTAIDNKPNLSDFNKVSDTANTTANGLNNLSNTVNGKADQSSVDSLNSTVNSNQQKNQNATDALNTSVNNLQTQANNTDDDVKKIKMYFTFTDTGMTIGKTDSPLSITISNQEMDFKSGTAIAAFINGQMMHIPMLVVDNSLIVGVHKIEKYNSEITLFRWVG